MTGGGGPSGHIGAFLRPRPGSSGGKVEDSAWRRVRQHRGNGERGSVRGTGRRYKEGSDESGAVVLTV